jgi:cytosine/adenosine deaminase-related metal-dependent hydrolase
MNISNVIIPDRDATQRFDLTIKAAVVSSITPSSVSLEGPPAGLLLHPICHPHIHLDKAYLLTCHNELYSDLLPQSGTFAEAMELTSAAKSRYTASDLYDRGAQLLAQSYSQGVTSLRAFVEVDHVVDQLALTIAVQLRRDFAHLLEMQICVFAQDALFSGPHGEANRTALSAALKDHRGDIGVLGTTPYVEADRAAALANVNWAVTTALQLGLHLDFHLDYSLRPPGDEDDSASSPLIFAVLRGLVKHAWPMRTETNKDIRTVVLGHCTQLTLLSRDALTRLAALIRSSNLPVYLVGLPTSDLYILGRPGDDNNTPHARPRATLQVVSLVKDYGVPCALAVNNIGNAFGPFGTGDPLALASWGVGLYHAGTEADADLLYELVSRRAREAIGLAPQLAIDGDGGSLGGKMLLIHNQEFLEVPAAIHGDVPATSKLRIPARQRLSIRDVVWDPPEVELRRIIHR